jgi:5-formyltetrahydrofolate cyclo-ligase
MDLVQQKKRLRKEMKEIMSFIVNKTERSEELLMTLIQKDVLKSVKIISIFITLDDEVDTLPIVQHCWENGITVTVPEFQHATPDGYVLRQWKKNDHLYETQYGIFHPKNSKVFPLEKIDLIFVPGMAFSKDGLRLGRGKGFYDRMLSMFEGKTVGLCFKEQIKEKIPSDQRDVVIQEVLSC